MTGILIKSDQDTKRQRERTMWAHTQEKAATYKPRREASDQPCQHPDVGLRTSRSEERGFRCFSHSLWYLVMTALESNASRNERTMLVQAHPRVTDGGPCGRALSLPNRRHTPHSHSQQEGRPSTPQDPSFRTAVTQTTKGHRAVPGGRGDTSLPHSLRKALED